MATPENPWMKAFLAPTTERLFHGIVHRHQVDRPDPGDVPMIHADARAAFSGLLSRATGDPKPDHGRTLLLLGEAGSGKTHLMRAFRNEVHENRLGYCCYLQMAYAGPEYPRYLLGRLIDSLGRPYHGSGESGLMRLSTHFMERPGAVDPQLLTRIRNAENPTGLYKLVNRAINQLYADERLLGMDPDLLAALIAYQNESPLLRTVVHQFLQCNDLSPSAREVLHLVPMTGPDAPMRALGHLGRIIELSADGHGALTFLIDQLETVNPDTQEAERQFARACDTLVLLGDEVPNSVVVISSLAGFWERMRDRIKPSVLDRLTKSPREIRLETRRSIEEIEALIRNRLGRLWAEHDLEARPEDPFYPFDRAELAQLDGLSSRRVLEHCHQAWEESTRTGVPPRTLLGESARPAPSISSDRMTELWAAAHYPPPEIPHSEEKMAALLAAALPACGEELPEVRTIETSVTAHGVDVRVTLRAGRKLVTSVALTNMGAQGGGLQRQLEAVAAKVRHRPGVFARSGGFTSRPTTKVARKVADFVKQGWSALAVQEEDWRSLAVMTTFHERHAANPAFSAWLREERPLTQLPFLQALLDFEEAACWTSLVEAAPVVPAPPRAPDPAPPAPRIQTPAQPVGVGSPRAPTDVALPGLEADEVEVGTAKSLSAERVRLPKKAMLRHAAVLGGTGSGKTTLAMALLERLVAGGTPVILVDRKGDLVHWANPTSWMDDRVPARVEIGSRIRARIFTPGDASGRDLMMPVLPPWSERLTPTEIEDAATHSCDALAAIMGLKPSKADNHLRAVLKTAIALHLEHVRDPSPTLSRFLDWLQENDHVEVALPSLGSRIKEKLCADLSAHRALKGKFLEPRHAETLDMASLLRPDAEGKVPLTVISTVGLSDPSALQFWMTRFLSELFSFLREHPCEGLQGVLFLDEADVYLPATSKPPTKPLLESALKRWRSAGMSLMIATQSPGDLDYKSRDNISSWFVGKLSSAPAIRKVSPLFSDSPIAVEKRLPKLSAGEFFLLDEGKPVHFMGDRSLIDTGSPMPADDIAALARRLRDAATGT